MLLGDEIKLYKIAQGYLRAEISCLRPPEVISE